MGGRVIPTGSGSLASALHVAALAEAVLARGSTEFRSQPRRARLRELVLVELLTVYTSDELAAELDRRRELGEAEARRTAELRSAIRRESAAAEAERRRERVRADARDLDHPTPAQPRDKGGRRGPDAI